MANKSGDKSFFSRFRKSKEDKQEPENAVDAVVTPEPGEEGGNIDTDFPATQLLESDEQDVNALDPSQTVDLNWDESEESEKPKKTQVVTDVTATREPTAVLDVPLSADDGEPTTLRLALMKSDDLNEEEIPEEEEIHDEVELEPALPQKEEIPGIEPEQFSEPESNGVPSNDETGADAPEPEPAPTQWARQAEMDCKAIGDEILVSPEVAPPGFLLYSETLARLIRSCETPMSIAINGVSGSTGAAFMKMVMEDLVNHDEGETRPVWFNAWDYSVFGLGSQLPLNFLLYLSKVLSKVFPKGLDVADPRHNQKQRLERLQRDILELGASLAGRGVQPNIGNDSTSGASEPPLPPVAPVALMDKLRMVKRGVKQVVDDYLDMMNASKIVIFIEGLDLTPPAEAAAFLLSLRRTMSFERCVLVAGCNVQRLVKPFVSDSATAGNHSDADTIAATFFNLSFTAPLQEQGLDSYLEATLKRAGLSVDSETRKAFTLLLKDSPTAAISDLHEIVNTLVVSDLLRKSGVYLERRKVEQEDQRLLTRILFGMACLKKEFPLVFTMLGEEMADPLIVRYPILPLLRRSSGPDGPVEAHIAATIRARLDAEGKHDREAIEAIARRGARRLIMFRNVVFPGDSEFLSAAETDLLDCGIRLASYNSYSEPGFGLEGNDYWVINGFCRRVMEQLRSINPLAPELHTSRATWMEGFSSQRHKIWHNPSDAKAAWGADRLYYFLALDTHEKDRLTIGVRYNVQKLQEQKISRESILKTQSLKQLKSKGFLVSGPDNQGWTTIAKELREIEWTLDREAVSKAAAKLNDLIELVRDRFDIGGPATPAQPNRKVRIQAPCPKCGKSELESVGVGKDGTVQLRCGNCNAKVASKSKVASK